MDMMVSRVFVRRSTGAFLISLFLLCLVTATAWAQEAPPFDPETIPPPSDLPITAFGASIYAENCAPCHGETGMSDGPVVGDMPSPPPALADSAVIWEQSPALYFHTTKFGRIQNMMPPWGNRLSDEEIWQTVYYAMTLHTDQVRVAAGQELYAASCASCHGADGAGDGPDAEDELADLSDGAAMLRVSNADLFTGWQDAHAEIGADWSQDEQRNVLDFIRTFTFVPPWDSGYRAGRGVVEGQVVQGTADGSSVAGVPVRLRAFINFRDVATFNAEADAEGRFRFENLMTADSVVYSVEAEYDGVRYGSNFFEFGPDSNRENVEVTVHAAGADASAVITPRVNWVIDFEPGALIIGQVYNVGNTSDRAFTGQDVAGIDVPVTYVMPLPEGATGIQLPDGVIGEDYRADDTAVYDTRALQPGEISRQIFVSYGIPVEGDSIEIELPVVTELGALNLLVAELPNLDVAVAGLPFVESNTIQGADYGLWGSADIPTDTTITVALDGVLRENDLDPRAIAPENDLTGGNEPRTATETAEPIGATAAFALGGLLALVLAGVFVWSTRKASSRQMRQSMAEQKNTLLHQIAALDDQRAHGDIDNATWEAERARLKRQLLLVARALEEEI